MPLSDLGTGLASQTGARGYVLHHPPTRDAEVWLSRRADVITGHRDPKRQGVQGCGYTEWGVSILWIVE